MSASDSALPTYKEISLKFYERQRYDEEKAIQCENYQIFPMAGDAMDFIYFAAQPFYITPVKKERYDPKVGKSFREHGLKFHITLPEMDRELFNKECNILIPLLMSHGVDFKILKEHLRMSDDPDQAGKDVTIYASYRPDKSLADWKNIIKEITVTLVENHIPPGYLVESTFKKPEYGIEGCHYVSYRYEINNNPKTPKKDFLKKVYIDVEGQEKARPYVSPSSKMGMS